MSGDRLKSEGVLRKSEALVDRGPIVTGTWMVAHALLLGCRMRFLTLCSCVLLAFGCDHDRALGPPGLDAAQASTMDMTQSVTPDLRGQCGWFIGGSCPGGYFCDYPAGTCGRDESVLGTCTERPSVCPGVDDPVCGCDGMTWGNNCARQAAGASLDYDGVCGCDERCAPGLWCASCKQGFRCIPKGGLCD